MTLMLRACSNVSIHSRFTPLLPLGARRGITCTSCAFSQLAGQLKHNQSTISSRSFYEGYDRTSKSKPNTGHILQDCDISLLKHLKITRRKIDSFINQISASKTITDGQSLFILKCCGNLLSDESLKKRTELVLKVWKKLEDNRASLNTQHYNALMRVHLQNEHPYDPVEFLKNMKKKNIKPNQVSYERLIAAHCSKGDLDGAFYILDEMKNLELPIGKSVFDALVAGYSLNEDFEKLNATLATMSQLKVEPDHETYQALLCSYAMHNRIDLIISTLNKCREQDIFLDDLDLLSVVYSAAMSGNTDLVHYLLVRMPKSVFYNQHCIDVILRLINQQQEDTAFRLLLTMKRSAASTPGQPLDLFFIHSVVKSLCPPEKIIDFCRKLVDLNLNPHAYVMAYDSAHAVLRCDLITAFMNDSKLLGGKLNPEHFWPLLNWQSNVNDESSALTLLNQMNSLDVNPNIETVLRILPRFRNDSAKSLFSKLVSANVPPSVAAGSLLIQSLERNDFRVALEMASKYRFRLDKPFLYEAAARAYLNTLDAQSLTKLIHLLLNKHASDLSSEVLECTSVQVVSHLVDQVLDMMQEPRIGVLQLLFETLLRNRLFISKESCQRVQVKLADRITLPVEDLLRKLSLQVLPPTCEKTTNLCKVESDIKKQPKKQPFDALIDKISSNQKLASLTNMYHQIRLSKANNHENAKNTTRILYLTKLLVEADRSKEALMMLEQLSEEGKSQPFGPMDKPYAAARNLMDAAVRKGDVNLVQQFQQSIESSSLFVMNNDLLSPLVRVHLQRDDLEDALMAFEYCVTSYLKTPLVTELLVQFIRKGDIERQQHIIDISSRVLNEKRCMHYHAFAYLQCGLVSSARIVFKTPGLRAYLTLLEEHCIQCVDQDKEKELTNLISITRELFGVDRHRLYYHLLTIYINANNVKNASTLCTRMEEEGIKPSKSFLTRLVTFLKSSNRPDILHAFNDSHLPIRENPISMEGSIVI